MTILVGDCLDLMRTMDADSIDAIVTDPPYHLVTGKKGGSGAASLNATPYCLTGSRGFMGMAWDGGDVAMRPETWAAALRVAKPGAYLAAFGGTRTYHRMACAIEDAGWELRDTLMWVYGSGFPKSKNLNGDRKGWGTALKPAWEPIVLARKPLVGTVQANVLAYGTGALNIDGCRVAFAGEADEQESKAKNRHADFGSGPRENQVFGADTRDRGAHGNYDPTGRWPANLVHDGLTDEWARFFYCAKASRSDRNDGCEALDAKPLHWSSGDANPGSFQAEGTNRSAQNHHPTVKPTDLMRWLCRLVTPPGGLVLDPFTGSGSTGRGAVLEGFRFLGCELSDEYAAIARARLEAVRQKPAANDGPQLALALEVA